MGAVSLSLAEAPGLPPRPVIAVSGELDEAAAVAIASALEQVRERYDSAIVDLSGVSRFDDSALEAVAERCAEVAGEKLALRVFARGDAVDAAFDRAGLGGLVEPDERERVRGRRFV